MQAIACAALRETTISSTIAQQICMRTSERELNSVQSSLAHHGHPPGGPAGGYRYVQFNLQYPHNLGLGVFYCNMQEPTRNLRNTPSVREGLVAPTESNLAEVRRPF